MATAFELAAFLRLDKSDYDNGIRNVQSETSKVGSAVNGIFSAIGKVGKAASVGLTASFAEVSAGIGK